MTRDCDYTHEWERLARMPHGPFHRAVYHSQQVVNELMRGQDGLLLCADPNNTRPSPPYFGTNTLNFNGVGPEASEPFSMPIATSMKHYMHSAYCRTGGQPYDVAVCACLIIFHKQMPGYFFVKSPGDNNHPNWNLAREFCQRELGYGRNFNLHLAANRHLPYVGLPLVKRRQSIRTHDPVDSRVIWRLGLSGLWIAKAGKGQFLVYDLPGPADPIHVSPTLVGAQWWATVHFLHNILGEYDAASPIHAFFANATVQGWVALHAAADWMEEQGDPKAAVLRSYFPKQRNRRAEIQRINDEGIED